MYKFQEHFQIIVKPMQGQRYFFACMPDISREDRIDAQIPTSYYTTERDILENLQYRQAEIL